MSWKPAAPRSEKIIRNAIAKQNVNIRDVNAKHSIIIRNVIAKQNMIQQKASGQKPEAFSDRFVLALSGIHYKIKVTQK